MPRKPASHPGSPPRSQSSAQPQSQARPEAKDALALFHPTVQEWFRASFPAPTVAQVEGWPAIARGESTLIVAPTGTGKTLAAFLWCINRVMFEPKPAKQARCRIVYVSPLKALAVDVERNLQSPLLGISKLAEQGGVTFVKPTISLRTGDTPSKERARFQREPADILITTPESLYLLLTSNAREALRSVDTVIIDEIHALVPTKRGAHLALSLERLQNLTARPLQRIGLSATQRPLEEVAHFLGGAADRAMPAKSARKQADADVKGSVIDELDDEFAGSEQGAPRYRPVTIVDAHQKKALQLRIEVPVEDMARLSLPEDVPRAKQHKSVEKTKITSLWAAIHPRLLELIQASTTALIFVNARRTAEQLAGALNELAGQLLVRAHHGSLAPEQRREVEELLKAGAIKAIVATSSLELGIDMGAVDLVIQIESPPSVAAGMQRIGRASHQVGAVSSGIIIPKFRGDLVACAAIARSMHEGQVEATRYPRNPLDVLAQQIAAMVAMEDWSVDELYQVLQRASPYATLSRTIFESVLDMLSGRYPSDEFADLRPRITWDRASRTLTTRQGTRSLAVINAGTIPDRGTYGVFLLGAEPGSARVGELDEEMVFESRTGDTFLLGASTWRIEEITHDRVLVSPAPGEPGRMPFWHGDRAGRPLEFGQQIGAMVRQLRTTPRNAAIARLVREHDLTENAAENLLRYLFDQQAATEAVPDDQTILIERVRDELGDWRVCVLTPFGSRVHAPWAMAVAAKVGKAGGPEVEIMWGDDGFVVRFPEIDEAPDPDLMLPSAAEAENLVVRELGGTAMFAAKFREIAGRALLLPKRRPGGRTPLWHRRKRSADLLSVASRYASFPMLLETYRECLRDVFDMPALAATLRAIGKRTIQVKTADTRSPSPFAAALLFAYVANYIYDGDSPLAERRAQALAIDQNQLKELLGDADFRELLDAAVLEEVEEQLQCLDERYRARNADALHDLLRRLGDLSFDEVRARCASDEIAVSAGHLVKAQRVLRVQIADQERFIAVEDAGRYRDALGIIIPGGVPEVFLESGPEEDAREALFRRYARTHGPLSAQQLAGRYGLERSAVEAVLKTLVAQGRLLEGEFRPHGSGREWCDEEVLRLIRRKTLAKLRRQVEPVDQRVLGRLLMHWSGVMSRRKGLDALLDAVESLQGAALPASILETEILPARVREYEPGDLDALLAAGEVVWGGLEPLGEHDGRIALYLTDSLQQLWRAPAAEKSALGEREQKVFEYLRQHGASFFAALHAGTGGGYPGETVAALWNLVWSGLATNDTFHALRVFTARPAGKSARRKGLDGRVPLSANDGPGSKGFHSRRAAPAAAQGRWSLVEARIPAPPSPTQWSAAMAQQLLNRYGVLTREAVANENLPGGFSAVYEVLKRMEESGRVRRGYFIAGLGATQFAMPAALDLLRTMNQESESQVLQASETEPKQPEVVRLAATDPANPYGAILRWPEIESSAKEYGESRASGKAGEAEEDPSAKETPAAFEEGVASRSLSRTVGASVILVNGALAAYLRRGNPQIAVFLPPEDDEPARSQTAKALAEKLHEIALEGDRQGGLLISDVNGVPVADHPFAQYLREAGFAGSHLGYSVRRSLHLREEVETRNMQSEKT